jgi:hypothetical protein
MARRWEVTVVVLKQMCDHYISRGLKGIRSRGFREGQRGKGIPVAEVEVESVMGEGGVV